MPLMQLRLCLPNAQEPAEPVFLLTPYNETSA